MSEVASYQSLCQALQLPQATALPELASFYEADTYATKDKSEIFAAGLHVLFQQVEQQDAQDSDQVDFIAQYIQQIDVLINTQLNRILHHEPFQRLEALWRQVAHVVSQQQGQANIQVDLLDVDKEELREDFDACGHYSHSALFEHVYRQEYDTPGGIPYAAIITDYDFGYQQREIALLQSCAKVAEAAQCPLIANVSEAFFQKNHIADVMMLTSARDHLETSDYIAWRAFRETNEARYIGLTLPKFLLRLPYGNQNPVRHRAYTEFCCQHSDFLWGRASFAFGANLLKSFGRHGWAIQIRGEKSGGKVADLPLYEYSIKRGLQKKIPTESLIPESRELELANLGFIPLSIYKEKDFACFYSANSVQAAKRYHEAPATANAHLNTRLPYVFLASRIAHYLKVLQRENIGAAKNAALLEQELNDWLQRLVTKMHQPDQTLMATHPLKMAKVLVLEKVDNPGFFEVQLFISPHHQLEGVDVTLSLVAQMPAALNGQ